MLIFIFWIANVCLMAAALQQSIYSQFKVTVAQDRTLSVKKRKEGERSLMVLKKSNKMGRGR